MNWRAWPLAAACVSIAVALLVARPAPTPGPMLRDFEAYWSAGNTWNAGRDAYGRAIWNSERGIAGVDARRDEILPFVNPPPALLGWSVLARLPYAAAARVWWVILALALLASIALVVRRSGARVASVSFPAALALAIGFGPVTSDLALGQIALLALLGVVATVEGNVAAAALGTFVAFLQPNVALGLASQLGRNRTTLAIFAGAIAAYGAGALTGGWNWPVAYARLAAAHGAAERLVAIQFSPASIAYGFGASPRVAGYLGAAVALAAVAGAVFLTLRVRDRFARLAAFAALTPLVAGFFHEHDLVVAYVAAVWCAVRARGSARVAALAGTMLVAVDWFGLAQRPTGTLQSALLATAALCAFVALHDAFDLRGTLAAAIPIAVIFAAASQLANRYPAPVWPDTLGTFHAAANAPIASVWLAEQRAAGLLNAVPAWSLLRLLPLFGCVLLAYAIYRHSACRRTA